MRVCGDEAEILTLGVLPGRRRQGVGAALLDHMISWSVRCGAVAIHLETASANLAALGLYRAKGFAMMGRRRNYYVRGNRKEDAIVLRREL